MQLLVYNPLIHEHTKTLTRKPTFIYGEWHAPANRQIPSHTYIEADITSLRSYLRRYNLEHPDLQCLLNICCELCASTNLCCSGVPVSNWKYLILPWFSSFLTLYTSAYVYAVDGLHSNHRLVFLDSKYPAQTLDHSHLDSQTFNPYYFESLCLFVARRIADLYGASIMTLNNNHTHSATLTSKYTSNNRNLGSAQPSLLKPQRCLPHLNGLAIRTNSSFKFLVRSYERMFCPQIPSIPSSDYTTNRDLSSRHRQLSQIQSLTSSDPFIQILEDILPYVIPISYLESIDILCEQAFTFAEQIRSARAITSYHHHRNDLYKCWIMLKKASCHHFSSEVYQHGSLGLITPTYNSAGSFVEPFFADKYFTWGMYSHYADSSIPAGLPRSFLRSLLIPAQSEKILIVLPPYLSSPMSLENNKSWCQHVIPLLALSNSCPRCRFVVRPYIDQTLPCLQKLFREYNLDLDYDLEELSSLRVRSTYALVIFAYHSSGFAELLAEDIPTISYVQPDYSLNAYGLGTTCSNVLTKLGLYISDLGDLKQVCASPQSIRDWWHSDGLRASRRKAKQLIAIQTSPIKLFMRLVLGF